MIYYMIKNEATSGGSLSADPQSTGAGERLTVSPGGAGYSDWIVSLHESNEWNVGITLMNKMTGMLAVPHSVGQGSNVIQVPVPADCKIPDSYVWQTNVVGSDHNIRSIMPLNDADLALSVIGHPHIALSKWSANPVQIWRFHQIDGSWS